MIIQGDNDGGPGGALTIIMLQLTRIHTPQLVNKTQRVVSETYQIINEPQKLFDTIARQSITNMISRS